MAYEDQENSTRGPMRLDRTISAGNIVSWGMILAGFILGFAQLQATSKQALGEAVEAKIQANLVAEKVSDGAIVRARELAEIAKDVAVTKEKVLGLDKKLDDYIRYSKFGQ